MDETPRPAAPLVMSTTNERNNSLNKHVYKQKILEENFWLLCDHIERKEKRKIELGHKLAKRMFLNSYILSPTFRFRSKFPFYSGNKKQKKKTFLILDLSDD